MNVVAPLCEVHLLQRSLSGRVRRHAAGLRRSEAARLYVEACRAPVVSLLRIHLLAAVGTGEIERHVDFVQR